MTAANKLELLILVFVILITIEEIFRGRGGK